MKDGSGALPVAVSARAVAAPAMPDARDGGSVGAGVAALATTLTRPPPRQAGAVDVGAAVDARVGAGSGVVGDIGGFAGEAFAAGSALTGGEEAAGAGLDVVAGFVGVGGGGVGGGGADVRAGGAAVGLVMFALSAGAAGGGEEAAAFSGDAVEGAVAGTADDDGDDGDGDDGDGVGGDDAADDVAGDEDAGGGGADDDDAADDGAGGEDAGGDSADDDDASDDGAGVAATGFTAAVFFTADFFAADGTDADGVAAGATSFAGGATGLESAGASRSPCMSADPAAARRRRGLLAAALPALSAPSELTSVPALATLPLPVAAVFVVRLRGARLVAALFSTSPAAAASGSVATFLRGARLRGAAFAGGVVVVSAADAAPLSPAGVAGAACAAAWSADAVFLRAARLRGGLAASSFMTEF